MKVDSLFEAAEAWHSKKAKDLFIEKEKAYVDDILNQLKAVPFSVNGNDLKAAFTTFSIDENYDDALMYKPKGKKDTVRGMAAAGLKHAETEYRLVERVRVRGTLSNGDVVEIELRCQSVSYDPNTLNFRGEVIGGLVKRGDHVHYLTLPILKKRGGGGDYRKPTPRIQILTRQLAKYQQISDKLGKAVIAQKEKGLKQIKAMHADPSLVKANIHTEIDAVSKELKKLSLDNQLGKLSKDEFKKKIVELTDRLRSF